MNELQPIYDSRKSFYGKAHYGENSLMGAGIHLRSYETYVAKITDGKPTVKAIYSQTTARHIKEFLKQNGFKAESNKQIMNDYGIN